MAIDADVIIIGGGLSGLALADHLQTAGVDYMLLEARSRLGGRIKVGQVGDACYDLGPSWFWPDQPRMAALVKRFNLTVFNQYSTGSTRYEDDQGRVHDISDFGSMQGSYRLQWGIASLVNALAASLDQDRIKLGSPVVKVLDKGHIEVVLDDGLTISANRIVLALPPRVSAKLSFQPRLPQSAISSMQNIPTWMGGQAKFVAVYENAFWRDLGLSGDGFSQLGPLGEIHDACDLDRRQAALFGFVSLPADARTGQSEEIKTAAIAQLARLFGDDAMAPEAVFYQDWAFEVETASISDHAPLNEHPIYGLPKKLKSIWDRRLYLGSSEVAENYGGFLEGALDRATQLALEFEHYKTDLGVR